MKAKKLPKNWRAQKLIDHRMVDGFEFAVIGANGHLLATMAVKGDSKAAKNAALLMAAGPEMARALVAMVQRPSEMSRARAFLALQSAGVAL